jgi:antitoxin component YwqK of YwqJK toxin-antitoxin module
VVRLHTVVCVLTWATACGSGPSIPKAAARELPRPPPPPPSQVVAVDAGVPDAPEPPQLACDPGTEPTAARPPDPPWYGARPDGTRHGPFVTLFPDGTIEITGSTKFGALDGPWQRRRPGGAVVESGSYANGQKSGHWQMFGPSGALLGEYDMTAGTGTERFWLDDGTLYSERTLKAGVAAGEERIYAADGTPLVIAQWTAGKLDGPHVFGTRRRSPPACDTARGRSGSSRPS